MLNRSTFGKLAAFVVVLVLTVALLAYPTTTHAENNIPYRRTAAAMQTGPCVGVSEIPTSECDALVALYNSTDGANWTDHTDWLNTTTPCSWSGIACDTGHVAHLFLGANNLTGSIPAALGNLPNLLEIYFYGNSLSGGIPPELGSLSSLQVLNLYGNQLTSTIPSELGSLANLQVLDLGSNQLTGSIPSALGSLSNLQTLYLGGNALSGNIPTELGSLANLQEFHIGDNQLTGGIPSTLGNLSNLLTLDLQFNQLSGTIPPELGSLTNLQWLNLKNNQLSGSISSQLGNLTSLQKIYLGSNQLTGSIPAELGNLTNLQEFYLYANQLSGAVPPELGNLTNLHILDVGYNVLTGSIPPELGSLSSLQVLNLSNNQLTGAIPSELGSLANLQNLDLSSNLLSDSIPDELGNLTNLQMLGLAYNVLTGSIPAELGNLTNLIGMGLNSNHLTGSIPPELGNLSNLHGIGLSANNLSGSIPPELGNLTNLETLDMLSDNLSGSIPSTFGNLTHLRHIELAFNHLTGSIPSTFGNLTNLQELFLAHNRLSGAIPSEFGNIPSLQIFDIADNQLSGDIPAQLTNLTNIQTLSLEFNMLTASDTNLITWLNTHQPGWDNGQTIPPTNVQASPSSSSDIHVSWTPILYTNHGGYYEVDYSSSSSSGPFDQLGCMTADKTVSSCDVSGLPPNTPYYFAVRTFTPAHSDSFQENDLLSSFSTAVLGTTYPTPPNDDFLNATPINIGPSGFSDTEDVSGATLENGEPIANCGGFSLSHTVWYKYVSLSTDTLTLDTSGSDYNTILSVWTGPGWGILIQAACNDDNGSLPTSAVTLNTTPGLTYYIRVSSHNDIQSSLTLNASVASGAEAAPQTNYVTTDSTTLTWNVVSEATDYDIQVSHSPSFNSLTFSTSVTANYLWVTVDSLEDGVYYWRVSADGGTTWSDTESFVVDLP